MAVSTLHLVTLSVYWAHDGTVPQLWFMLFLPPCLHGYMDLYPQLLASTFN